MITGAILTSLTGMDAYTQGLQTISNNVANLNSIGYKQTIESFSNLVDQGGVAFLGGGQQDTGAGVHIASTLTDYSQGTMQATNNDLDLAIQGSGFIVVMDKSGQIAYSRTGSFAVDKDGFISDQATGERLAVLDANGQPVAINLNDKQTNAPTATTKITFTGNIGSDETDANVSNVTVFDDHGGSHVWKLDFKKSTTNTNEWDVTITDSLNNAVGTATIDFTGTTADPTSSTPSVTFTPANAGAMNVTLDFSAVTSFSAGTSTIATSTIDGNAPGTLSTITIDDHGAILLTYSNQKTASGGSVALASFRNPQLLTRQNNGVYRNLSGETATLGASNTSGLGALTPKSIEASNVDLSSEFGDLILLQRGFQACSEVISVSNDMIQQLFAIRGQ